jgi:hypothetical protein
MAKLFAPIVTALSASIIVAAAGYAYYKIPIRFSYKYSILTTMRYTSNYFFGNKKVDKEIIIRSIAYQHCLSCCKFSSDTIFIDCNILLMEQSDVLASTLLKIYNESEKLENCLDKIALDKNKGKGNLSCEPTKIIFVKLIEVIIKMNQSAPYNFIIVTDTDRNVILYVGDNSYRDKNLDYVSVGLDVNLINKLSSYKLETQLI